MTSTEPEPTRSASAASTPAPRTSPDPVRSDSTTSSPGPDPTPSPSSRRSRAGAGWGCTSEPLDVMRGNAPVPPVSWFSPRTLWMCRNDVLARHVADPVAQERARWVGDRSDAELTVDLSDRLDDFSFLLMGDTGAGDRSQWALVSPLEAAAPGTAFLFLCSDVLYPIGNVNDYGRKFYLPYATYPGPIYAIPGNHDWYDDLYAFMWHLCGRRAPDPRSRRGRLATLRSPRELLRLLLWRRPSPLDEALYETDSKPRAEAAQRQPVPQPGPYYVIDTKQVRFVGIDTGIAPRLDRAQAEWFVRVSADPRPKVLLTGSPLYVDAERAVVPLEGAPRGYTHVDEVVKDPANRYVAAIGGDIHNYQRYPVQVGSRTIQYLVAGGGGAFMHATHTIPKVDLAGVAEADFRCYPLRRDSLAAYSRLIDRKLTGGSGKLQVTPEEAAGYLSGTLGLEPHGARGPGVTPGWRARVLCKLLIWMGFGPGFHKWFSPYFDWDTPPLFKHFLKIEVTDGVLRIRCYGVHGCVDHSGANAPCEDDVLIPLDVGNDAAPR
jgi:Calcineurin-like phosphoesterase